MSPSVERARSIKADTLGVLVKGLHAISARHVLDLGCGNGTMAAALVAAGFDVTGIDPAETILKQARINAPGARFICAGAEALPPELPKFDAAIFVNTLHHVPAPLMQGALCAALAAVRSGGVVRVIEPLASGSFFRAMLPVEDETTVRRQAIAAVDALIASGSALLLDCCRWDRESTFLDMDGFIDYLVQVDPARAQLAQTNAAALVRAWDANIQPLNGRALLIQPLICWTLGAR